MRLLGLYIQNFKGIKGFMFEPNGKNANLYGDNATGKTTIADAFSWLLFGKDSAGQAVFAIKPLDADNNEIHNLETSVEGKFEIQGKTVALRKVFKEKWTKPRGKAKAEFSGHTTDHYVDGVPVTAGEYKQRVGEIGDEELFKILTDPSYFNEGLHWEKR
ncbi:MAG: ATP-binding protein, partial [bacterium]